MNKLQRRFHLHHKLLQLISFILLWLFAYNAAYGCWVDFYEYPQYIGAHIRLVGPIRLADLKDVHGANWDDRIDSLVVSKKARVSLFDLPDFQLANRDVYQNPDYMQGLGITKKYGTEQNGLTFNEGEKVEHLGVWNFHKKTKSVIIDCVPQN